MKNVKRKLMMPLMVMAFAIAGAFMTNSANANESALAIVDGYRLDMNNQCENTEIECTNQVRTELCTTESDEQLFELSISGTTCPNELYKIE